MEFMRLLGMEDRGMGRQCDGNQGITVFKQESGFGQGIQVGSPGMGGIIAAEMIGSLRIECDEDDVAGSS
jgi:hypothetical protein